MHDMKRIDMDKNDWIVLCRDMNGILGLVEN